MTIGRKKIQPQDLSMLPQPGLKRLSLMVPRIIENNNRLPFPRTMLDNLFQKLPKGLTIELQRLSGQQLPLFQKNGTIHSDLFPSQGIPKNRVFNFGRNPQHASRTSLLKMALAQTPEINVTSLDELTKVFYMCPELLNQPRQLHPEVSDDGIPDDEKAVDTAVLLSQDQTLDSNDEITKPHPTVPGYIPMSWTVSADGLLTAFVGLTLKKTDDPSFFHPPIPPILSLENSETNIEWSWANDLKDFLLHSCSTLAKERATHGADGHILTQGTWQSLVPKRSLPHRDHHELVFPWQPT